MPRRKKEIFHICEDGHIRSERVIPYSQAYQEFAGRFHWCLDQEEDNSKVEYQLSHQALQLPFAVSERAGSFSFRLGSKVRPRWYDNISFRRFTAKQIQSFYGCSPEELSKKNSWLLAEEDGKDEEGNTLYFIGEFEESKGNWPYHISNPYIYPEKPPSGQPQQD